MSKPVESPSEMLARVKQMAFRNEGTWDLSENDTHALQHVVGLVQFLAADISIVSGYTPADVLRAVAQRAYVTQMDMGVTNAPE